MTPKKAATENSQPARVVVVNDDAVVLPPAPLPNYTLSTVCPACDAPTVRRACKVRCERCGFLWDCSEL